MFYTLLNVTTFGRPTSACVIGLSETTDAGYIARCACLLPTLAGTHCACR